MRSSDWSSDVCSSDLMLSNGRDVFTVASELAKQGADATDLGKIAKADLPVELADPVFALEKGGITQPINGPFGWHVLKVTGIEPGKTRPFEEVRDKLHKELAREEAVDALYKRAEERRVGKESVRTCRTR